MAIGLGTSQLQSSLLTSQLKNDGERNNSTVEETNKSEGHFCFMLALSTLNKHADKHAPAQYLSCSPSANFPVPVLLPQVSAKGTGNNHTCCACAVDAGGQSLAADFEVRTGLWSCSGL